jgi:hypothetical protein
MVEPKAPPPLSLANSPWTPIPDPTALTAAAVTAAKEELRREVHDLRILLDTRLHTLQVARQEGHAQTQRDLYSLREILEARLNGMDQALVLADTGISRAADEMDKKLAHLKEVHEKWFLEKLASVQVQFAERDTRMDQMNVAAKEAVATALQAAKEAVGAALQAAKEAVQAQNTASASAILKSETSTDKRIDETVRLLNTTTSGLEARLGVITEQSKNTMTRQEVEQLFRTVMDKLDGPTGLSMRLENMVARTSGREDQGRQQTSSTQWVIGAVIGGSALVIALLTLMAKLH